MMIDIYIVEGESRRKIFTIGFDADIIAFIDGVFYEVRIARNGKFCISPKSKYNEVPPRVWSELDDLRYLIIDFRRNEVYDFHPGWLLGCGYRVVAETFNGILERYFPESRHDVYRVVFINTARRLPYPYEPDITLAMNKQIPKWAYTKIWKDRL